MTNKCCLNCVYLCRVDETGKRQILPDYLRNFDLPEDMQKEAGCYHDQWQALPVDNELGVEPWDLVGNDLDDGEIVDLNGNRISLDAFSCHFSRPSTDKNHASRPHMAGRSAATAGRQGQPPVLDHGRDRRHHRSGRHRIGILPLAGMGGG